MRGNTTTLRVRMDDYTRVCLTAIAGLLVVLVLGLWADRSPTTQPAQAQIEVFGKKPEASSEVRILAAQEATAQRLAELIDLLQSGKVKVQVVETPGKGGASASVPNIVK